MEGEIYYHSLLRYEILRAQLDKVLGREARLQCNFEYYMQI